MVRYEKYSLAYSWKLLLRKIKWKNHQNRMKNTMFPCCTKLNFSSNLTHLIFKTARDRKNCEHTTDRSHWEKIMQKKASKSDEKLILLIACIIIFCSPLALLKQKSGNATKTAWSIFCYIFQEELIEKKTIVRWKIKCNQHLLSFLIVLTLK